MLAFERDMPARYRWADLALSRSGAMTVAELAMAGLPSLLVPYPYAADDHQRANAANLVEAGAAWLLPQDGFTPEGLADCLDNLLMLPETLTKATADARLLGIVDGADRLADVALGLAHGGGANGNHPPPAEEAAE